MMAAHNCQRTFERIIHANAGLWSILQAARDCALPDWYIGAGAICNAVWDHLHGYSEPTPCADVAFFDPSKTSQGTACFS